MTGWLQNGGHLVKPSPASPKQVLLLRTIVSNPASRGALKECKEFQWDERVAYRRDGPVTAVQAAAAHRVQQRQQTRAFGRQSQEVSRRSLQPSRRAQFTFQHPRTGLLLFQLILEQDRNDL